MANGRDLEPGWVSMRRVNTTICEGWLSRKYPAVEYEERAALMVDFLRTARPYQVLLGRRKSAWGGEGAREPTVSAVIGQAKPEPGDFPDSPR